MADKKSVYQKLFDAFNNNKGVRLSPEDVEDLVCNEAIGCLISCHAIIEAGGEIGPFIPITSIGSDINTSKKETWNGFKQRLIRSQT